MTSKLGKGAGVTCGQPCPVLSPRTQLVAVCTSSSWQPHPVPHHPPVPPARGWSEGQVWTVSLTPSPSRFKYVLVNTSTGLVQDQTLWSDPISTNWRKSRRGDSPGGAGRQGQADHWRTGVSLPKVSLDSCWPGVQGRECIVGYFSCPCLLVLQTRGAGHGRQPDRAGGAETRVNCTGYGSSCQGPRWPLV